MVTGEEEEKKGNEGNENMENKGGKGWVANQWDYIFFSANWGIFGSLLTSGKDLQNPGMSSCFGCFLGFVKLEANDSYVKQRASYLNI